LPHFFISSDSITEGILTISDENNYKHIAKSLRAKIGEKLLFIDEKQIQHEGIVQKITSKLIEVKITKSAKSNRKLDFALYLAQSPLRSDAQSLIVEKATELGVAGLYPILTDNCALNKEVINKKIPKWQKTMAEASKQCERADVPTCFEHATIQTLFEKGSFDRIFAFVERKACYNLKEYLRKNPIKKSEKILVIIGPEGGFSQDELEFFKQNKIPMLSLGNLILKAETAAFVALGNIIYEYSN